MIRHVAAVALLAVATTLVGCSDARDAAADCSPVAPQALRANVVRTLPHAADAYTQGLVVHDGALYESTGLVGQSTLRELDPATGEELRRVDVDSGVFAEGLAVGSGGRLVQLTWTDGVAYEWEPARLDVTRRFAYSGEGWGLTTLDDGTLVMSDGSDTLVERDPDDFSSVGSYRVQRKGGATDALNELEWDGESIWANRYRTDEVLRIDPDCATVTGVLDVEPLRADATAASAPGGPDVGVANGIAHLPGTDRYLLTGKNWPTMYEVTVEP